MCGFVKGDENTRWCFCDGYLIFQVDVYNKTPATFEKDDGVVPVVLKHFGSSKNFKFLSEHL